MLKPFGPLELLTTVATTLKHHGKRVPTAEERAAQYGRNRAQLASEWNMTPERLDMNYEKMTAFLSGGKYG